MASQNSYIATVIQWPGTFAPENWAFCEGQMLNISEYQDLYSILSNRFGGDGRISFALPDMRGRIPIGAGESPWNIEYILGQHGGTESIQLTSEQLPTHKHTAIFTKTTPSFLEASLSIPVNTDATDGGNTAVNKYFGKSGDTKPYYTNTMPGSIMASVDIDFSGNVNGAITLTNTGGSTPVSIVQPYISLHYIICVKGIYPPHD